MTDGGTLLDLVLLAGVALFALSGYRQGFVVGVLSFVGFLGGGLLGAVAAPTVAKALDGTISAPVVGLVVVFVVASLGQVLAATLGVAVRRRFAAALPIRLLDSGAGGLLSAASVLLVAWFLASAIVGSPYGGLVSAVRGSSVLAAVDGVMPTEARTGLSAFRRLIDDSDFPRVFDGIVTPAPPSAAPPDPTIAGGSLAGQVRSRVLKITGTAPDCSRRLEGTGFVIDPERVMTNAHVLAGVRDPVVEVGSQQLPATVVVFDPDRDVAVLYVPGLGLTPLPFGGAVAEPGDDALVAGYPEDGPYTVVPARIRGTLRARGPDIYQRSTVTREIYSLRAQVRPGNSGGPLFAPDGRVTGVIFAAAVGDPETGYALTAAEVGGAREVGKTATTPVSTQGCD